MTNKSIFGSALSAESTSPTVQLLEQLKQRKAGQAAWFPQEVATRSLATEGFTQDDTLKLSSAVESFKQVVQSAYAGIKFAKNDEQAVGPRKGLTPAMEAAGISAAAIATAGRGYTSLRRHSEAAIANKAGISSDGRSITEVVGHADIAGALDERLPALEAYDERENKEVIPYAVTYNLQAARQGEFGETFFPTIIIAPDQVGFNVSIRLLYAYNEVSRSVTGALDKFGRQNLIRAIIDSSILAVQQTQLIPVYRSGGATDNTAVFAAGITAQTILVDNASLTTAPYAVGVPFSILGVCQTNAALAAGTADQTDAVDSSVRLSKVYLKITSAAGGSIAGTEYIPLDVQHLPTSDFNYAVQGNTRRLALNFSTSSVLVGATTLTVAGTPSTILGQLTTNTARLKFDMFGSLVQDLGDTVVQTSAVSVAAINTSAGTALDPTASTGLTIANILATATIVGYDLLAFRTNSDRRFRGKLLDIQHMNYLYTVPLLPPISAIRPVASTDANDGNLLSDLVTATRTQCANAAVTALLLAKTLLSGFASTVNAELVANSPKIYGSATNLVTPTYLSASLAVDATVDSIKSQDRAMDIQVLLFNKIRDMAMQMFVASGYGPASESMHEGQPPKPVVLIGCDPIAARYLTLNGDTRLTGDTFDYKIVMSYDSRMANQIILSFGQEAAFNSGVPNPLHFGNMAWRPELTIMMPMVRNGAQSMELTVMPSYRHVPNLPIMGSLTVSGLSAAIASKVPVNMHTV